MKSNDKLYKGTLILSGLLMIIGFAIVTHLQLDDPVFLKHYIDTRVDEEADRLDMPVTLKYITNADDDRSVTGMEFPEYPDLEMQASENVYLFMGAPETGETFDENRGRIYGQYSVREVYLQVSGLPDRDELSEIVLTEATILFNDSSSDSVDIGEIHLYAHDEGDQPLEQGYGSSSTEGETEVSYRVLEDLSLSMIDTRYYDQTDDRIQIEVNGADYSEVIGQTIQEGESLTIMTMTEPEDDLVGRYTILNTTPELTVTTAGGTEHSRRMLSIAHIRPDYSFSNIYRYLRERGAM